eukprot:Colp12_sorted_trinity150504_noHs@4205
MARSLVLLYLLVLCASVSFGQKSVTVNDITVDYVGASGQMKIYGAANTSGNFFMLRMDKIEEFDAAGNSVNDNKITSFASQVFNWVGPSFSSFNGVNTTTVSFNATLSVGVGSSKVDVPFALNTSIFESSVTVMNGNQSIIVPRSSLKFTVSMSAWPFKNVNNTLHFSMLIDTKGPGPKSPAVADISVGSKKTNDGKRAVFAGGYIDSPVNAVVNGLDRNITVDVDSTGIHFVFPSFTSLVYDPVVGTGINGALTSLPSLLFTLLAIVALSYLY